MEIVALPERKKVSLYLDADLKRDLEIIAKSKNRTLNNLIEVICQKVVDQEKTFLQKLDNL